MGDRGSGRRSLTLPLIIPFLVEGKGLLHRDPSIISLHASELGELGELGASRFPGPKRVRAKDAKDAKV